MTKLSQAAKGIGSIFVIAFVLLGLLDLFSIVDFGTAHGAPALAAAVILLELLLYGLSRKFTSKTLNFLAKALVVATLLELTLFQLPSYSMLFGSYEEDTLLPYQASISSATGVQNFETDQSDGSVQISGKDEVLLTIENVGHTVGSMKVNLEFAENTDRVKMVVDMADETHEDYRYDVARTVIINGQEDSEYMTCLFSGDVSMMRIKFTGYKDTDTFTINSIVMNQAIPLDISAIRFLLIVGLSTFAYAVIHSGFLKKSYGKTKGFCAVSVAVMTCAVVVLSVLITGVKLGDSELSSHFKLTYGNQITQELVDAFENKQVHLLKEPSRELMEMENPYDWSARNTAGASSEWDHVYYEGKYYSYYGIAPVLTLFLPYHMITGYYCSTNLAIFLFSAIGLVFLALTYMAIVKRWFRDVPSGCILAGMLVLFSVCGIWFSVSRPLFYEISISSGFMFVTTGAYFLITSNMLSEGRISLWRTALASLLIGLAVLSRPTLAVYAICACVFYVCNIRRSGKITNPETQETRFSKLRMIVYILCGALPIGALGALQMWYNLERFGSPLDFGIQYSLTINDFTHAQFHIVFMLIGLFNYLFAVPGFSTEYPYIRTPFSRLDVNGYYFSDSGNTSGILFLAFPVLGYLLGGNALRRLPTNRDRIKYSAMVGLPCVIMPLVIICSVWESGYAIRYTADFSWEIVIGALAILFFLYTQSRNRFKKDLFRYFMAISAVAAIIINGVQIFYFAFPVDDEPALCYYLESIVAFWK